MSRKRVNLVRALIEGILAGLAMLALGSLHVVAETPKPAPSPNHLALLPFARSLQDKLVLVNPLALASPPATPLDQPAPRVIMLPPRAPLAVPPPTWRADLNPASLVLAMSTALAPAPAPALLATRPSPPTTGPTSAALSAPLPRPSASTPSSPMPRPIASAVDLQLTTHHSLVVQSPVALTRVSITDDTIAQAIVVSPYQVLVQGRAPGEVSLLLWDADSNARAYTVQVGLDPMPLQRELSRLYPHQLLRVSASGEALVVSGVMENAASAKQVLAVSAGFSKNVVNDLSVDAADDPGQVLLQVRFAEVDRTAITQFGANLLSTGAGKTIGALGTEEYSPPTSVNVPASSSPPTNSVTGSNATFGLSDLLNVFLFRPDANLGLTLKALQQQNLLQILAEPNLVAMDGKEASFLAGGEFPFPVVQGQGSVNNVTIQFKPFGVNLHFKPTILPDGTIDLQVAPEVSSLDFSNALTVSGFLIPALSTRRAETEMELGDGQSFVIAGLLDNNLTDNVSKLPGLSEIPILGKFFTSRNTNKSRSELVVVVTAHLIHPSAAAATGPKMPQPFLAPEKFDGTAGKVVHP